MENKTIQILGLILISILIFVIVAAPEIRNWLGLNQPKRIENSTIQQSPKSANISYPEPIQRLINDMVRVQGGVFEMGCTSEQTYCHDDEYKHTVTLSSFNIGKYEVTQDQWQAVMSSNPSHFKDCGRQCPVESVSWYDVKEFIRKLSHLTGRTFRLPTEAEWEYAARGRRSNGYIYAGSNDIDIIAWCDNNNSYSTHTVGRKNPNELGLYDMSGNVYEWCQDWYGEYNHGEYRNPTGLSSGESRIMRGGCWGSNVNYCRVSARLGNKPGNRGYDYGFRIASPVDY